MASLTDIQSFIDAANRVATSEDLGALVDAVGRDMGFDYYALVHHVELTDIADGHLVALSSYPESWIETYIETNICVHDPVHLASHRTNVGFAWEEVPNLIKVTAAHRKITAATRKAGIGNGYTIPANVPGEANGSCSFALRVGRDLPRVSLPMAQLIGSFGFQAARKLVLKATNPAEIELPMLTSRQLECVVLAGRGKTDWEIAIMLGLSEDTVTEYLDEARRRYDVTRRIQVVMRAVFDGQIPLTELVR